MGYKIGICGCGGFAQPFIELFKLHPLVDEVVIAELRDDARAETAKEHQIERVFKNDDELIASDVDAIAIFTQRWTHAPIAIKALKAGKHVYSSVPAGVNVEEMQELVETVKQTGLTYALGETSFYRPQRIYCRQRFAKGDFGDFVYGEGHYYHHMAHWFYRPFFQANGPQWRRYASVPPIWYISHSASHILGVTMGRFTKVACIGRVDNDEDGLFDPKLSAFDNPYSNQTALFRTVEGGMARINEFRRSAAGESRQAIFGTKGAYEEQYNPARTEVSVAQQIAGKEEEGDGKKKTGKGHGQAVPPYNAYWSELYFEEPPYKQDGSFDYQRAEHLAKRRSEDVSEIMWNCGVEITEDRLGNLPRQYLGKEHLGAAAIQPVERLPEQWVGVRNGHCGSHQFLLQDFLEAMDTSKLPPNHVWLGVRYSLPGAVAHESCMREGEWLTIPDFGTPPEGMECIDPLVQLKP
jgi:predicted dehydrogenase